MFCQAEDQCHCATLEHSFSRRASVAVHRPAPVHLVAIRPAAPQHPKTHNPHIMRVSCCCGSMASPERPAVRDAVADTQHRAQLWKTAPGRPGSAVGRQWPSALGEMPVAVSVWAATTARRFAAYQAATLARARGGGIRRAVAPEQSSQRRPAAPIAAAHEAMRDRCCSVVAEPAAAISLSLSPLQEDGWPHRPISTYTRTAGEVGAVGASAAAAVSGQAVMRSANTVAVAVQVHQHSADHLCSAARPRWPTACRGPAAAIARYPGNTPGRHEPGIRDSGPQSRPTRGTRVSTRLPTSAGAATYGIHLQVHAPQAQGTPTVHMRQVVPAATRPVDRETKARCGGAGAGTRNAGDANRFGEMRKNKRAAEVAASRCAAAVARPPPPLDATAAVRRAGTLHHCRPDAGDK